MQGSRSFTRHNSRQGCITWSASSDLKFGVWEIDSGCVWATSIDVTNTESGSPRPAVVLQNAACLSSATARSDLRSLISHCFTSRTLARSGLKPSRISEALIPTLFLPKGQWDESKSLSFFSDDDDESVSVIRSRWFSDERRGRFVCIAQFRHNATLSALKGASKDIKRD